ncbi:hypothetical protein IWX92DRAFT_122448 [Phyllosticta citricarpa]
MQRKKKKKKKKKKSGILDSLWPTHHQRQLAAGMPERGWQCPRLVLRLRIETRGVARPFGSPLAGWLSEESSALKRRELTIAKEFPDWEMPSWFSLRRPHAGRSAGWRRTRINAGINLEAPVWTVPRNYFRIILCVCGCATSSRRGRPSPLDSQFRVDEERPLVALTPACSLTRGREIERDRIEWAIKSGPLMIRRAVWPGVTHVLTRSQAKAKKLVKMRSWNGACDFRFRKLCLHAPGDVSSCRVPARLSFLTEIPFKKSFAPVNASRSTSWPL